MKKTVLISLLTLFALSTTQAQVSLGPRAGYNPSTLTGENKNKKYIAGFNAGVVVNIEFNRIFSIQPELSFSQQGYQLNTETNEPFIKENFDYINFPVLAKATFGRNAVKGYINVGPYTGYMISGKSTVFINGEKFSGNIDFEKNENVNRIDFGIVSGVGLSFETGGGNMMLDARYNVGLSPVSDKTVFEEGKDTNSVFAVTVGYLFPLGTR